MRQKQRHSASHVAHLHAAKPAKSNRHAEFLTMNTRAEFACGD
jgi:hypothetical protein